MSACLRPLWRAAALAAFSVVAVSIAAAQPLDARPFLLTDFGGQADVARDVLIQPNGKIVVAGWAQDAQDSSGGPVVDDGDDVALARYTPRGRLDPRFSKDGKVRTDLSEDLDAAYAVVRQDDGKLVVAGTTGSESSPLGDDFLLVRYRRNGSVDRSFGDQGIVKTAFQPYPLEDVAYDLAIQPNGKLVVVGRSMVYDGVCCSRRDMAVARYLPDGSLDPSFSGDGMTTTDFDDSAYDEARAVAVQRGRILVAGTTGSANDFALARYRRNGELDESFSADGKVTTSFGTSDDSRFCSDAGDDIVDDIVIQPDGKIVAVGYSRQCQGAFGAARYLPDGRLDRSFGREGRSVILSEAKPVLGWVTQAVVNRDGSILVGGNALGTDSRRYEPDSDFALARLRPSGRLDDRFSTGGIRAIDLGDDDEFAYAMAKRGDRAVVVGTSRGSAANNWDWGLAGFRAP